jgi:hypothetical protein
MSHNNLGNFYETLFAMQYHHKVPMSELEEMIVFEKDMFVDYVVADIKRNAPPVDRSMITPESMPNPFA